MNIVVLVSIVSVISSIALPHADGRIIYKSEINDVHQPNIVPSNVSTSQLIAAPLKAPCSEFKRLDHRGQCRRVPGKVGN